MFSAFHKPLIASSIYGDLSSKDHATTTNPFLFIYLFTALAALDPDLEIEEAIIAPSFHTSELNFDLEDRVT